MDKRPSKTYLITVKNAKTGTTDDIWNQQAESPEQAIKRSDEHLRQLGWPAEWRTVKATER